MRMRLTTRNKVMRAHGSGSLLRAGIILRNILLSAAVFAMASAISLQAQTPAAESTPVHRPAHPRKHTPAHAAAPDPVVAPPVVVPPVAEKPNWPAFADAAEATIVWNNKGLSIDAANSSLQQILKDVSTATGIKVDGISSDQRIFGAYGPGRAADVLSQLLQGSGYNVLMIGDLAPGTPRQIILSTRQAGASQPQPRTNQSGNQEENEQEEPVIQEPEQPQIQPAQPRPGFPPGGPPRSPQQFREEMQQRQQQQQQQPEQQPNNQPN